MRSFLLLVIATVLAPGILAAAPSAEILNGTGLHWGMSEAEVEQALHARITTDTQFGRYYIPQVSYEGLTAACILNFAKDKLTQVSLRIIRPDKGDAQARFDSLAAQFKQWYGKPASPLSVESPAVTSLVWATPEAKVALQVGVEQPAGKPTAVISAIRRVLAEDAVTVDAKTLAALPAGGSLRVGWGGTPVMVVRRSQQDMDRLKADAPGTDAPDTSLYFTLASLERPLSVDEPFVRTPYRSLRPEVGVYIGVSPQSACTLMYQDLSAPPGQGAGMGFYDPCDGHGSWDSAGRPEIPGPGVGPLVIPKYHFEPDGDLVVGS